MKRLFLLIAFLLPLYGAAQTSLTPGELRGKQIYTQGNSASGKEIITRVGDSDLELPAGSLPCANCHGLNGQGKAEGGVRAANLTWEILTSPLTRSDGRKRPPHTERTLELAVTRGVDPAGKNLLNVMPRFSMSREDLTDLIAYLKKVGTDRDPGVTEDKIVIGTIIPANGPLVEMGHAIKAVISAFFEELNNQGGIYNRKIELKFAETGDTPAATRANVARLLADQQVFAMSGGFIAGAEKEIVSLMAEKEAPLIGPLTLYPQTSSPINRQVFYLLSGIEGQARALVNFAAAKPESKTIGLAVVYPQSSLNLSVAEAIKDQSKKYGLKAPQTYEYAARGFDAAETVKQLKQNHQDVIFFLGTSEDALALIREADKAAWLPSIYLPGGSISSEVFNAPLSFDGKVFVSFPTSPADQTPEGMKEFRSLAEKYKLPAKHVAAQLSVYCAAKVLVEALKRVGRDLSREKLIQTLEGFYEYQTGLTPAITYSPNRRIGANGAYVITIDLKNKQFRPVSGWISVD